VTDENEQTEQVAAPSVVPPEAYERQKATSASEKARADTAEAALSHTVLVDKVYEHFKSLDPEARPANPYEAAKAAASRIPSDTDDVPAAVAALVAEMSALQPQTVADAPPPPMAGDDGTGPQPGATGGQLETGPFPLNSPEFKKYFEEHGKQAANVAIANGMFIASDENLAAQSSLDSV